MIAESEIPAMTTGIFISSPYIQDLHYKFESRVEDYSVKNLPILQRLKSK